MALSRNLVEERTARLRLVAGTLDVAIAEMEDPGAFAALLDADVPKDWPPETLRDALPWFRELYQSHPEWSGWLGWYAIQTQAGPRPVLCGSVGFKGAPDPDGMVEIGYSVLPAFQGQGLASEMVEGLVAWAFRSEAVVSVEAETTLENRASIRVLERNAFHLVGAGLEPDTIRFRRGSSKAVRTR